jgi:sulfur carrier protein
MKIVINSEEREFKNGVTLQEVLQELSLVDKVMAAAVNMNIVKESEWQSYEMSEGDKLELLDFVGGG